MNILDFWKDASDAAAVWENTDEYADVWNDLMLHRSNTAWGFYELEKGHGALVVGVPLSDSAAQDSLRLLLYRTMEEVMESVDADSIDHAREEAIDAINYLLGMVVVEKRWENLPVQNQNVLVAALTNMSPNFVGIRLDEDDVARINRAIFSRFSPFLRNRAWTAQTQHFFFDYGEFYQMVVEVVGVLMETFESMHQFWQYFLAKDAVLQFRLRSQY